MSHFSEAVPGVRLEPWMCNPPSMTPLAEERDGPDPARNEDGSILDNLSPPAAAPDQE